jgi:DNA polymerase elongation subunit (family B)
MKTKLNVFPYFWHHDENEKEVTVFRIYALTKENKTVVLRVNDFTPYSYLELPIEIDGNPIVWDSAKAQILTDAINSRRKTSGPIKTRFLYKKKLYYSQMDLKEKKEKLFPYLLLAFSSTQDRKFYSYAVHGKKFFARGIGNVPCRVHEEDASAILQFTCHRKIPTAGWIEVKGEEIKKGERITLCDREFVVKWKDFKFSGGDNVPQPLICSMDIEVNSTNPNKMPDSDNPGDKIFQISCVLRREGSKNFQKFLLTLGNPDQKMTGRDVTIMCYKTEADLLNGYAEFLQTEQPNIVTGYNILGFDIPYMIDRAKFNFVIDTFRQLGFPEFIGAEEKQIKWSSAAYKVQNFKFLDAEGILHVDLLPLVKRDYKFNNYKLKTVSEFFIGQTKDPLGVKGIFKCYRIGMKGGRDGEKALAVVGKYCVQDSVLVSNLFEVLQTWVGLCEMAKVCNVPMFYLYTKGQQIKVYSQVYKKCMYENRVVEKDGYIPKEDEYYTGAYVFEPKPGVYDKVVPFDFSSLYPTTIIAYNIDYSTLVIDKNVPDNLCNVIEWEDHIGCCHDTILRKTKVKRVICAKRKYRFRKSPIGVMPSLLRNLLDARTNTKREMKTYKKELAVIEDKECKRARDLKKLIIVLNKRQLSFKVSANSMYGSMGVHRGYLPFIPGAMCTTAWGRVNIQIAAKRLQEVHNGDLVYGDTDSCYINFPWFTNADKLWDYCLKVEEDVSSVFPPPMRMAFEEVIYWRFLILTKKRYMYLDCGRDGKVSEKVGKKGVLLARRDNSSFIRLVYEEVVEMIFDKREWDEVMKHLLDRFNNLCSGFFGHKEFVITKSIGEIPEYAVMSKNVLYADVKKRKKQLDTEFIQFHKCDYTELPEKDKVTRCAAVLDKYDAVNPTCFSPEEMDIFKSKLGKCCYSCAVEEWRARKRGLPAHIQLAEKMRRRGQRVDTGSRLEYIVTTEGGPKSKLYHKLEHPDYFKVRTSAIKLEYLYYLKLLGNSMDQLLEVTYKVEKFTINQYKFRLKKQDVLDQLKSLFEPKIEFLE